MAQQVLDAINLGERYDAGETVRMQISKIYRIRHERVSAASTGGFAAARAHPDVPGAGTRGAGGCGRTRSCG